MALDGDYVCGCTNNQVDSHILLQVFLGAEEPHSTDDANHTLRNSLIPRPHGNEAIGEGCSPSKQTDNTAHIISQHCTLEAQLFDVFRKALNQTKQSYGRPRKNIKHTPANTTTISSNSQQQHTALFPASPSPWGCAPTHSNTIQPCSLPQPAPGAVLQLTATPYSLVPCLTQPLGLCKLLYLGWTSIRSHTSFIKSYS